MQRGPRQTVSLTLESPVVTPIALVLHELGSRKKQVRQAPMSRWLLCWFGSRPRWVRCGDFWNCGNSTISAQDAEMLLEQGWPVKKCHFHGRCMALTTDECHSFRCQTCLELQAGPRADCSWARLRGSQTGSESITHAFAWSSPNLNPETIC